MFIDQAHIQVKAGDGGHGCVSFHREKFIAKGGPDGGDGGRGGSVYFMAVDNLDTLLDFSGKPNWHAKNGLQGMGRNRFGADGDDLIIKVPPGTLLYDKEYDLMLKDLTEINKKICVCRGGRGGKGNKRFATSVNQTPRLATNGQTGQKRELRLELKLIADVGLLGIPNAGKSTFVSRCSAARPKIADYPFTTLEPVLGIAELSDYRRYVVADIPGIIEGAHQGVGLGLDFLRHIERTTVLAHVIDIMPKDQTEPVENYRVIRRELERYSKVLADKPEVIVANKMDLDPDGERLAELEEHLGQKVHAISAVTGAGIKTLSEHLWQIVQENKETL